MFKKMLLKAATQEYPVAVCEDNKTLLADCRNASDIHLSSSYVLQHAATSKLR